MYSFFHVSMSGSVDMFWVQHLPVFARHPPFLSDFYFTETRTCFFHAVPFQNVLLRLSSYITARVAKSCNCGCQFITKSTNQVLAKATLLEVYQQRWNSNGNENWMAPILRTCNVRQWIIIKFNCLYNYQHLQFFGFHRICCVVFAADGIPSIAAQP